MLLPAWRLRPAPRRPVPASILGLLFTWLCAFSPASAQAAYTSEATVSPDPVEQGATAHLNVSVTSTTSINALIDVEVYSSSSAKVFQKYYDNQALTASVPSSWAIDYPVPADAAPGTYQVKVGVFKAGWGELYYWDWDAGQFQVTASTGGAALTFSSEAIVTPELVYAGEPVDILARVTASDTLEALIDVEVYDEAGTQVFQEFYDDQTLTGGVTQEYPLSYLLPEDAPEGVYAVHVAVFGAGWGELYDWNDQAGQFEVMAASSGGVAAYASYAVATPNPVAAGSSVSIDAHVTSSTTTTALIDVEVYDASGVRVYQNFHDQQALAGGVETVIGFDWSVPVNTAVGSYSIHVGVFSAGWGELYDWNWAAGQVTVSGSSEPTPTPTPDPTPAPTPAPTPDPTPTPAPDPTPTPTPTPDPTPTPTPAPDPTPTPAPDPTPMPAPDPTPTPAPDPTPTPTPAPAEDFVSSATASPDPVAAGSRVSIDAHVTSSTSFEALIDVEVRSPDGQLAYQRIFDDQLLTAGAETVVSFSWTVPATSAPGRYSIQIGIFGEGWSGLYDWNGAAGDLTIDPPSDEPTPEPTPYPSEPLPELPPELPTHLGVGLSALPSASGIYGWLPDSGIPWDYAYQYLAGGVNTSDGWVYWNEDAMFPLWYAEGAEAGGYIPVFPYYQILHSAGDCESCNENEEDLANLNNPTLMASYFQDFILLMKRLGPASYDGVQGFGGTAIVHVEPDLSGYAMQAVLDNDLCFGFCTGQGNDPSFLTAAVASSGVPEVADFDDTYQGFSWALTHLRDLYAPNVLLAFHMSTWGAFYDVASSTDPNLDPIELGGMAGVFAALSGTVTVPAGVSPYDLVFTDVSDRDAGYKKYVGGQSSAFWDRLNVTLPNFHRWEEWMYAAVVEAGRPGFVWQIPLGNQYFRTLNNTNRHYQDNKVEYFMANIDELAQVGVVGLLFGPGANVNVTYYDAAGDGVTNPASSCTTDGVSSGQVCNDHESTVSDDDGGYMRLAGEQYFLSPYPL